MRSTASRERKSAPSVPVGMSASETVPLPLTRGVTSSSTQALSGTAPAVTTTAPWREGREAQVTEPSFQAGAAA
ncbi:hypothetical protein STIAU_7118 [Stigmatella aurantiaca DW4/3-1]|uniref:Uncharacterized protein n=1 Tax=Stigmatella aurantiaca (strain DW4/3-1) TaxID=378806 RepID=Q08UD4_STIAD|nr:hypothetical protein STIAU_7118 [Stigmatella aurantiaca DW4/3-1]